MHDFLGSSSVNLSLNGFPGQNPKNHLLSINDHIIYYNPTNLTESFIYKKVSNLPKTSRKTPF